MHSSRKLWRILTLAWLLLVLISGPGNAQSRQTQDEEKEYNVFRNLHYVQRDDTKPHRNNLDVYMPKSVGKETPVVIFVHGGGWKYGDKRLVATKPDWFTQNTIVLVSINYRFHPQADFRDQASDVAAAIKWTVDNSDRFNVNSKKIFLMGHSAGAHLVALVGTDPAYLKEHGIKPADLSGVIPVDGGGLNVPYQIELAESAGNVKAYKTVFSEDLKTQQAASPYHHLKHGAKYPDFLIAHVASRKTTRLQANKFAEQMRAVGGKATVVPARGKTHLTINRDMGTEGDPTSEKVIEFIMSKSGGETEPFSEITIRKTGGFAGIDQTARLRANGSLEFTDRDRPGRTAQLEAAKLKQVNRLVQETDWSRVPPNTRQKNTADDFNFSIVIQTTSNTHRFEIDGLSLGKQPVLKRLIELVTR